MSDKFQQYRRSQIAELRPYEPGEIIEGISISATDKDRIAKAWRHDCSQPEVPCRSVARARQIFCR
jgi:hypothetical protein